MAKAWIYDRWLKSVYTTLPDGNKVKVAPSSQVKRALTRASDPMKAAVPTEFRTTDYGKGLRWSVYWWSDGKRQKKNFASRSEAELFQVECEDTILSGKYVNNKDKKNLLSKVADIWLEGLPGTSKGSTEARYRREVRTWILPRWGQVPVGQITVDGIQQWVAQLGQGTAPYAGKTGQARPLAAASIRSIVKIVLKSILDTAVRLRWINDNPVNPVKIPRVKQAIQRIYLTPTEVKTLADAMDAPNASLVYVLAYTGIRIGEALALRCADVDLKSRSIRILRTQSIDAQSCLVETLPKGNRTRIVPIPEPLLPCLRLLLSGHADSDYMFRGPRGGRQTTNNWRMRVWVPALQKTGMDVIDGLVVHSLRHTYASLAIKAGADVKTLQAVLGHASATETLDTYADLWPQRTNEVADVISKDIML